MDLRIARMATALACVAATAVAGDPAGPAATGEVVVTGMPIPVGYGRTGRTVEVLGSETLRAAGVTSVADALERASSVSVSERGAADVQADLSIRGCTYQQVLVLVDGVAFGDSQSAHHNMNLPFPMSAVERIVVIPGPSSALFGPSAFGGVVDVVTRVPSEDALRLLTSYGSFDTVRIEGSADFAGDKTAGSVSALWGKSDGFQEGADYELWSGWATALREFDWGGVRLSAGHTEKNYGATNFYGSYPSGERTEVTLVDVSPFVDFESGWSLRATARYRGSEDEYVLYRTNPDAYRNLHVTDTFLERVVLTSPSREGGTTALGAERTDAELDSSRLGQRESGTTAAFVQHRLSGKTWAVDGSVRMDDHDLWGTEVSPCLSAYVMPQSDWKFRAAAGRGIRAPSFTELYYSDPSNSGNSNLVPEEAYGVEAGVDVNLGSGVGVSLTGFLRDTEDLIDWVRSSTNDPWEAQNIGETTFQGVEVSIEGTNGILRWSASYRYTDVDSVASGLQSKYALNYARHEVGLTLRLRETKGFSGYVSARYRDVPTLNAYWLLSARAAKRIGRTTVFVSGRNLLDDEYQETPGVPTAGRYLETGVELSF